MTSNDRWAARTPARSSVASVVMRYVPASGLMTPASTDWPDARRARPARTRRCASATSVATASASEPGTGRPSSASRSVCSSVDPVATTSRSTPRPAASGGVDAVPGPGAPRGADDDAERAYARRLAAPGQRRPVEERRRAEAADERRERHDVQLVDEPGPQQRPVEAATAVGHDARRAERVAEPLEREGEVDAVVADDEVADADLAKPREV